MKAFIDLKLDPGMWRNREISPGVFGKFASNRHTVPIGIKNSNNINKWYYDNKGWHMGCYYIKNPLHMTLDKFKKLLKKIALKFAFDDEGKKYFEGNCIELMKKIKEFMDILMAFLNNETQSKNWSYEEDQYTKIYILHLFSFKTPILYENL